MIQRQLTTDRPAALVLGLALGITSSVSVAQVRQAMSEQQGSFERGQLSITVLPQGQEQTIAVSKISDNGVVVGMAPPGGNVLRWLPGTTAPENLGGAPAFSVINRLPLISGNGAIIAANRLLPGEDGRLRSVPSTWTEGTGWSSLARLTQYQSRLVGMSRNGAWSVGYGWNQPDDPLAQPWVWTMEQGQTVLPVILPTYGGEAWAVSEDGRVVVGHQFDFPNPPELHRRFYATRWAEGNMRALTDETGVQLGQAYACSRDGSVVVGGGQGGDPDPRHPNFGQAWYWTEETGGVYLGSHPEAAPGTTYFATDVSADGSTIVGTYYVAAENGALSYRGFLWTETSGLVSIQELMAKHGVDYASNWHRIVPTAISATGDAILIAGSDEHDMPGGFILHFGREQDGPIDPQSPAGPQ